VSALTLVYQDDALRLYWNEQHQYYMSEWQPAFRKGDDLRRAYQACLDAQRARPSAPWLTEASNFAVIDAADVQWIEDVFWPEFVKIGARYQAAVSPKKVVAKMSAARATRKLVKEGIFQTTQHATRAEAEAAIIEWHAKQRAGH
jgi:hypothetical protein